MVGLLTDAAVFSALHRGDLADAAARLLSLATATTVTWRLNRAFTFGASGRSALVESSRYTLVALVAQGFNYSLFLTLRALLPEWPALAALLVSAGSAALLSFTGQRFFSFARQHAPERVPV